MIEDEETRIKKPKKWKCCTCGKEYCYMKGAIRHRKSKGCETHTKFKQINEGW
jgi:hypothetical protein